MMYSDHWVILDGEPIIFPYQFWDDLEDIKYAMEALIAEELMK